MYRGFAKVDATMGSEAALRVELSTSLQSLHVTVYVTPTVKFDKIIDDPVMSESSVEHTNIVAETESSFDESDTSATPTKTYSAP